MQSYCNNYINNVAKGKKIIAPIVFNGGVSKNSAVVKAFEEITGQKIIVNKNSHLMGAYGIALMAKKSKKENIFNFNIDNERLETKISTCPGCSNNCEVVTVYKNETIIDHWGNRCEHSNLIKNV